MSNVPPPNPFSINPPTVRDPMAPPYAQSSSSVPTIANPYASPVVDPSPLAGNTPETIRNYYLGHEASVRSMGTLYMLGCVVSGLMAVGFLAMFVFALGSNNQEEQAMAPGAVVAGIMMSLATVAQAICAVGLRKLAPWSRVIATGLSVFGLIMFPVGTLISVYFLYLLQSQKGAVVFSPNYQEIIQQTPHIKYKTSIAVWVLLALVIVLVVGALVLAGVG